MFACEIVNDYVDIITKHLVFSMLSDLVAWFCLAGSQHGSMSGTKRLPMHLSSESSLIGSRFI